MSPTVIMLDDPRAKARRLAREIELLAQETLEYEHEQIVARLAQLSFCDDDETSNHMRRVAHISRIVASQLGFDLMFCNTLFLAAPLHDLGKIAIPDHILLKPGRLTPEEWDVMKTHTSIGYDVLGNSVSPVLRMGADIAHSHHEYYDGRGYPQGLHGGDIPIPGRIVAVADELDALLSVRPYKPAWPLNTALAFMQQNRGHHFDPACVDAMLGCVQEIMQIRSTYADTDIGADRVRRIVVRRG
jgi:response regulator RpfG family c-di-GMP phosphodiesterase